MYTAKALFTNFPLMSALVGWYVAQICKLFTGLFRERTFDVVTALFGTGGMPSSHAATVCALSMASAIAYGLRSFEFAVTVILAFIVMRDASGVRRSAGEQAKIINRMIKTLSQGGTIDFNSDIKEIIGHTPFQVFVGAILGAAVPFLMMLIMPVR
ncbi:MAG: divergent PAP2 family protein [Clostridia bacterium]|nr:divergent PAP2 family protein [Clostridia bacterium]